MHMTEILKTSKNRLIRDGQVAVVYSRGYGAGWSSWNREYGEEELIFDPGLVELVLANKTDKEIEVYATLKWPGAYLGGLEGLDIRWVPEGTKFHIREEDGNEIVVQDDDIEWITA
jgi:hypothetical protein